MNPYYIIAPYEGISGGPELLHQLSAALTECGAESYLVYYDAKGNFMDTPAPLPYQKYNTQTEWRTERIDSPNSIVVLPEIAFPFILKLHQVKPVFWWLSVNGYTSGRFVQEFYDQEGLDPLHFPEHPEWQHLVQSMYAMDFVKNELHVPEQKILYLSDYLNDEFLDASAQTNESKENLVVYNPAKGKETLQAVIGDNQDISWCPIENMTRQEVHALLLRAKVYVDFGAHPGKDRIPREAAISGCCVITGRFGAANYYVDLPIPDTYKFEDPANQREDILNLIHSIFTDYQSHRKNFDYYCRMIRSEKNWFYEDVQKFHRLMMNQTS